MQRYFNTEGSCNPKEHYMVRLDGRLDKIKRLFVDRGKYFVINRGRQYGKTTTLQTLAEYLGESYIVLALDFQKLGTKEFTDASIFTRSFARMVIEAFETAQSDSSWKPTENFVAWWKISFTAGGRFRSVRWRSPSIWALCLDF